MVQGIRRTLSYTSSIDTSELIDPKDLLKRSQWAYELDLRFWHFSKKMDKLKVKFHPGKYDAEPCLSIEIVLNSNRRVEFRYGIIDRAEKASFIFATNTGTSVIEVINDAIESLLTISESNEMCNALKRSIISFLDSFRKAILAYRFMNIW